MTQRKTMVVDRPAGNRRLDAAGLSALRAELDQFWNRTLAAYKAAVERTTEETA
jgi:hypothetical protein